ncbi:nucleotidyltransferase [Nitriliruptor alkaliphilus]|uniref:nucleotidyltransferase n=1 Tax=Nitriliruptor alkaliphilus TaxID=427918 RepID=UPI0006975201|nr:nucleotidyltransferase [Nitriliruptor alkaliphilus]
MATMQLPDDFSAFLRLLNSHEVEYLLVGGYAVAVHGYPRATQDLDVWVAVDPVNAERLAAVLRAFGFDDGVTADLFLAPDRIVRMGQPPLRLEVLTSVSGLDFTTARARAEVISIDGVDVPVVSLADLRTNKAAAGRPKDLADLAELPEA